MNDKDQINFIIDIIVKEFPNIGKLNETSKENLAKFFIRCTRGENLREKTIYFREMFEVIESDFADAGHDIYQNIWFETYERTYSSYYGL